jgi:hypothetical protein
LIVTGEGPGAVPDLGHSEHIMDNLLRLSDLIIQVIDADL